MTSKTPALALAALGAAVLTLGACGKQGELERPRPLIGHGTHPTADQRTRDAAAARARADGSVNADPQAPQSAEEMRAQGMKIPREHQIAGAPVGPDPKPPPGVLPDPMRPSTVPQ